MRKQIGVRSRNLLQAGYTLNNAAPILCGLLAALLNTAVLHARDAHGAASGQAAAAPGRTTSTPRLHINIGQTRLKNGLRVLTAEDHRAPVISMLLAYDVGSATERPGRTGFAHLFEHLMFQGSEHVAPGQHMSVIQNYGGLGDATTGSDSTLYFESVPANQLDLALFLERDRLRSLNITRENFAREREVVKEERRMRIDNQPYRKSSQVLNELLYDNFAYKHEGIGSMADLDAASLEDIKSFFDTYYAVNNAVLVLVGDFDTKTVLGKVKQYFGDLPPRPRPPPVDRSEPPQQAERRKSVDDPLAPLPQLAIAFKAVPGNHPDFFALRVLSEVLQSGRSSRLHEALMKQRELVTNVGGYVAERRGPGAFYISATLPAASALEAAEKAIYEEIERLQQEPIADWELEKARNSLAAAHIGLLHRGIMRAFLIGPYAIDFNDPNRINTYLDRIAAVTKPDLQRVARTYLRNTNRTVVVTLPKKTGERSQ